MGCGRTAAAVRVGRRPTRGGRTVRPRRIMASAWHVRARWLQQGRSTSSSIWGRLRVAPSARRVHEEATRILSGSAMGAEPSPAIEGCAPPTPNVGGVETELSLLSPLDTGACRGGPDLETGRGSTTIQLDFESSSSQAVFVGYRADDNDLYISGVEFPCGPVGAAYGGGVDGDGGSACSAAGVSRNLCNVEEGDALGLAQDCDDAGVQGRRPGSLESHVRFLQHLVRGYRRLRGEGWARPGQLAGAPAPYRPVTTFRCRGGRSGASDLDFEEQRARSRQVLAWYGVYVDIYRRLSNKGPPAHTILSPQRGATPTG